MKKTYFVFVIIILIAVVGCYFGYKALNLYAYSISRVTSDDYYDFNKNFEIHETKTITKKLIEEDEYFAFKNMKIKNYFKDFKVLEENSNSKDHVKYALYNEVNEVIASFWIGTTISYTNMFVYSDIDIFFEDNSRFAKIDRVAILNDNNIINDVDLLRYLIKNKNKRNKIFTSLKEMQRNYAIHYFVSMGLPIGKGITIIDGDYTGYIFNFEDIKEVNILHNDKRYFLTFTGFDDEKITDIISTLVIE